MGLLRRAISTASRFAGSSRGGTGTRTTRRRAPARRGRSSSGGGLMSMAKSLMRKSGRGRV